MEYILQAMCVLSICPNLLRAGSSRGGGKTFSAGIYCQLSLQCFQCYQRYQCSSLKTVLLYSSPSSKLQLLWTAVQHFIATLFFEFGLLMLDSLPRGRIPLLLLHRNSSTQGPALQLLVMHSHPISNQH